MPTARELLDQVDALMRRNRKHGKGRLGEVPTLTDALETRDPSLAPTVILPDSAGAADPIALDAVAVDDRLQDARSPDALEPMSLDTLGDLPVLTDAVLDWPAEEALRVEEDARESTDAGDAFPASAQEAEAAAAELPPPAVLEREAPEGESAHGPQQPSEAPPVAAMTARVPFLDDDIILEIPPSDESAPAAAPAPAPVIDASTTLTAGSREWDALAEEIRMQVLQRLDLFTDTGLREQLGARLSPIVERASAQLIETINRELGELVRGYVAEAIEREIDSWRNQKSK
jgi:hypothetical protein